MQKFSGGSATADVVTEKIGIDHLARKHLAGVKYEDIVVEVGTGMSKGFYEWIKGAWDGTFVRKDGAVILADHDFKEQSRKTFYQAFITETVLPALDAASKDAAKMTVRLAPELVRTTAGGGKQTSTPGAKVGVQKKWLPANFKLDIPGLDCTRVNKIGQLVVKQNVVDNPVGELRDYQKEPAHLEFGNLTVTMSESHADSWYQWFEDFVVKGNCDQSKEKSGSLAYLTPDLSTELFKVTFSNLGIFRLVEEHTEAGAEGIRRVKAELYVERMQLQYTGAAAT
jgi:phage tail-like protein